MGVTITTSAILLNLENLEDPVKKRFWTYHLPMTVLVGMALVVLVGSAFVFDAMLKIAKYNREAARATVVVKAEISTGEEAAPIVNEEPDCPPSLYDVLWGNEEGTWSYAYPGECDALPRLPDSVGDEWILTMGPVTRPYEGEDLFVSQKDGIAQFGNVFSLFWVSGPVTQTLEPTKLYHFICREAAVTLKVRYHDPQWRDDARIRDLHGAINCKDMLVTEVKR